MYTSPSLSSSLLPLLPISTPVFFSVYKSLAPSWSRAARALRSHSPTVLGRNMAVDSSSSPDLEKQQFHGEVLQPDEIDGGTAHSEKEIDGIDEPRVSSIFPHIFPNVFPDIPTRRNPSPRENLSIEPLLTRLWSPVW